MAEFLSGIMLLMLFCLSIGIYILPTIVAYNRKHNNRLAICILNILGGWFVVGWIVALVWACTDNTKKDIVLPV